VCFGVLRFADRDFHSHEPNLRVPTRLFEIRDSCSRLALEHHFLRIFHGGLTAGRQKRTRHLPNRDILSIFGLVFGTRVIDFIREIIL
jgi:hypothetical protein